MCIYTYKLLLQTSCSLSLVTNHHIQKSAYVTDIHISDSTSLPSLGSDKDSKVNIDKNEKIIISFFVYSMADSNFSRTTSWSSCFY